MNGDPYATAAASARRLADTLGRDHHDVAVVLGSGWATAADGIGAASAEVAVADVGGFPAPTVLGHGGTVRSVESSGLAVLVFLGRVHAYEGHPIATVVHGVRTAVAAGCRIIVLTNAAGGVNADYHVGQPVLIRDHINLTGRSPLTGPPPPVRDGVRFVDLTDLYSQRLRALVRATAPGLTEGVYAGLPGPHFETPAEIRMMRTLGADLVGMSTVHEAIAAHHLGAEVVGISLVTNAAAGSGQGPVDHAEVMAAGDAAGPAMGRLLHTVIECSARAWRT
jgi:purine-nucleoside phosphorylase